MIEEILEEILYVLFIIIAVTIMLIFIIHRITPITNGERGRKYILFGICWFVISFILSLIMDLAFYEEGELLFYLSIFMILPGTCALLGMGARALNLCGEKIHAREAAKILYFGIFWFAFWLIVGFIITLVLEEWVPFLLSLLPASSGAIINLLISRWLFSGPIIPPDGIPHLSVERSPSKISITEGDEFDVKIELKNDGKDVAKSVSLSDRIPDGFKIISGNYFWTGDLKQDGSKSLEYTVKADKAGIYTIPRLIVKYKDKQGKVYEESAKAIEIVVNGEKKIFKLEFESTYNTIEIASDKVNQGVYSVRYKTPYITSKPESVDVGKDFFDDIKTSIDDVTEKMNRARGGRGDKEEKIEEYSREMLESLRDLGCIIYKQILPSHVIEELSKQQQIKHLELSTSEDLGEYPWEAMHDDTDADSFLCLKYALGRNIQVKGTIGIPTEIRGDKLKALVIGDPLEGCERELPMAKKEAEEVAKKLKDVGAEVKTLIGESATLRKVLSELGRGYDIIHYAGHAEFDMNEPRNSYLILRDEKHLKAKNITKQFGGKKKPFFAYINACKAGKRAEHEEKVEDVEYTNDVSGLASAFLEKGIYYIGSVWPIHDDASADAAICFYDNFLKGVSIGESLRKAKLEVYKKYKGKRTAWAGLVLYGNPTLTIVSG